MACLSLSRPAGPFAAGARRIRRQGRSRGRSNRCVDRASTSYPTPLMGALVPGRRHRWPPGVRVPRAVGGSFAAGSTRRIAKLSCRGKLSAPDSTGPGVSPAGRFVLGRSTMSKRLILAALLAIHVAVLVLWRAGAPAGPAADKEQVLKR